MDTPRLDLRAYPQLHAIAWHRRDTELAEDEAFALYEAHWRHVDQDQLDDHERALIARLMGRYAGGALTWIDDIPGVLTANPPPSPSVE